MKAKKVFENISFERIGSPLSSMDLGGYSFDTLKPGVIVEIKKTFATSLSGKPASWHSAKNQFHDDQKYLITKVEETDNPRKKLIELIRTFNRLSSRDKPRGMDMSKDLQNIFFEEGIPGLYEKIFKLTGSWYMENQLRAELSKLQFDTRFNILG